MYFCLKKVALLLALSFCFAQCQHHSHDQNHQDRDVLSSYDHMYHEYHHHHPIETPNCGQVCPKSVSKYGEFEVGQVYTIELDSKALINVKEGQTVSIKGKVDVHVMSPCEFALKLRETDVSGVPNPKELSSELDSSPWLRFGAHDGKILGVCPAPDDQVWTLNVKKSILSAIQVSTKDLTQTQAIEEVDFSGHCTTTYRPMSDTSDANNVVLEKSKDLSKCHLRRKNILGFNSKSLAMLTEFIRENLPILKGTSRCTQEIKNGHLFSVNCIEEHRLYFHDDSLLKSTVNLKFVGKSPSKEAPAPSPAQLKAESLLMTRDEKDRKIATLADTQALLKKMCTQVNGDKMAPEVTQSFYTLVESLRTLSETDTRALDTETKNGGSCPTKKLRHLFIGASAFAASDPSLRTIIDAYKGTELSETQITLLLSLVALKTRPSDKTIEEFATLIDKSHSPRPLVLGISLMVRNFCKRDENCDTKPSVKKAIDILIKKLKESDCDIERTTAIKALDNIRARNSEAVKNALIEWAQKSDADSGVRVAAIEALKSIANDMIRQKLIEILLKDNEPNEVRITAYRTVVLSGANAEQFESIKSVADPQIQNYIQTHIKNLKQSSNQFRRALLPQTGPQFDEPKSTSFGVTRNVEWGYKGLTFEANVIHPKGSLVPSLYSFGIYFGGATKDYQLFEFQIRQKGFEEHIKKLFSKGMGGPEMLVQLTDQLMELMKFMKDPDHKHTTILQISMKMSGRNIMFIDTFEDIHNAIAFVKKRFQELKNTETFDLARGMVMMDTMVEVPTINGLPLTLYLDDTVVLGVNGEHNVQESANAKIRTIKSSRDLTEQMTAGLHLRVRNYKPGFEYSIRMEMNSFRDIQTERIDGRVLKLKFNLPAERRTFLKLTQKTRLIDGSGVSKESNEISERPTSDDNTRCRQIFGLNICKTKHWLDNSPIPNVEYYYSKEDPKLDSIVVTLTRPGPDASNDLKLWTAKVNAGQREYLAQADLRNLDTYPKKVALKLVSPRRTITADALLDRQANGNATKLEFDLKFPDMLDINSKYNVEQIGDQNNVDVMVEYKLAGSERKESLKWVRKSSLEYKRDKKTKHISIMFSGEFMSSQFPKYNSRLKYDTDFRPYQTSKTNFGLEWGPDYKHRVVVSHNSKMDVIELRPFQMVSENNFLVEITPCDINYDFKINSDISMIKSKPRLVNIKLIGKDVNGRPNKDISGELKYERMEQPVQQTLNMNLVYPGNEVSYYSEVQQIKDLTYKGKIVVSPQKGRVITIEHDESITNPTQKFFVKSNAKVSFSWKPETKAVNMEVGFETEDKFRYKRTIMESDKKMNELELSFDKSTGKLDLDSMCEYHKVKADLMVDNVFNPKNANWGLTYGEKSYKFSATRVPKESVTLKLDSAVNSRLKEFKMKISRKDKSTLDMKTNENLEVSAYIDPFNPKEKRIHLEWKCPKHGIDHKGDIIANKVDRKITWESKTTKNGNPFITIDAQYQPRQRSYFILKKIKGQDAVSKLEYFQDKGVYGAVLDTSRFSAVLEGENREGKKFGKLGFVDKVDNYEHKSQFNITNGVLTVKSISDKEKETFTKLDAVIGRHIISEINLKTPKITAHLQANPLPEVKTLVFKYDSPTYDQKTNVDWVPRKYLKLNSESTPKADPQKAVKVTAHLTRQDESNVHVMAPNLVLDIKRVKEPKPHYTIESTINGYTETQEFDSNPNLTPAQNLLVALSKWFKSYTSNN